MKANQALVELHAAVQAGELTSELYTRISQANSRHEECEVLDFKQQLPDGDADYAKLIRDLIALHNSYGGFILFGVKEVDKDRIFEVVGIDPSGLQVNKLRDGLRAYTGSDIRIRNSTLDVGSFYLQVVWVSKRVLGETPVRFSRNGPETGGGKLAFKKGDVVFRRIDSNAVAKDPEDYDFLFSERRPPSLELPVHDYVSGDALEHNLPDRAMICAKFVGRTTDLGDLWAWLSDDFSRVRLIAGEGGLGKTSLAVNQAASLEGGS